MKNLNFSLKVTQSVMMQNQQWWPDTNMALRYFILINKAHNLFAVLPQGVKPLSESLLSSKLNFLMFPWGN